MKNSPTKEIKTLYEEFCKDHEEITTKLLAQAYKEGYNECVRRHNIGVSMKKTLKSLS